VCSLHIRMHIWWYSFIFVVQSVCFVLSVISPHACPMFNMFRSIYFESSMFLLMLWMFSLCAISNYSRLAYVQYCTIVTYQSVMIWLCHYIPSSSNTYCAHFECRYWCLMKLLCFNSWTVLCLFQHTGHCVNGPPYLFLVPFYSCLITCFYLSYGWFPLSTLFLAMAVMRYFC
jgi:hypothetical protein